MALGKIPAVWRRHRYPLSLHYQLSVLGISGEEQKKGWLQYSVGDAASYLAGTESVLEVFLPIAVSLFAELIGATLLEFFFSPFLPAVGSRLCCREKGRDFLGLFLEQEMVVSAAVEKVTKSKVTLIQ